MEISKERKQHGNNELDSILTDNADTSFELLPETGESVDDLSLTFILKKAEKVMLFDNRSTKSNGEKEQNSYSLDKNRESFNLLPETGESLNDSSLTCILKKERKELLLDKRYRESDGENGQNGNSSVKDKESTDINPCLAEPGYTLPLQTV